MKEIQEREGNGLLTLDAGDLLFKKYSGPLQEQELKRITEQATLIAETMDFMGYSAVGVGDDDLTLGKEFLVNLSKKVTFPFLSSNLLDEATGKPLFQTSLILNRKGLRIGIFSLLSPDTFQHPSDPRKKGMILQPPMEVAQAVMRELQPKTDLIVLLSHLGYPKDVQIAQALPGIHFIIGGHTGVNLATPPIIQKSLLLQMGSKGLYGGRLRLNFYNHDFLFFNAQEKRALENSLNQLKERIPFAEATEIETWLQLNLGTSSRIFNLFRLYQIPYPEEFIQNVRNLISFLKAKESEKGKALRIKIKGETEEILKQLQGRNEFTHHLVALGDQIKEHPEIQKRIEAFRAKYPEPEKLTPPRQEAPRLPQGTQPN